MTNNQKKITPIQKVQVETDHYYYRYDTLSRFVSYFYQIDLTRALEPASVLEIGIGNKTVTNYLRQHAIHVTTCDFDKTLNPDYIADIRNLPFNENEFEVVLAFEVLEHLPWNDVDNALLELNKVTSKSAIISLPYHAAKFELIIKIPLINILFKREFLDLFFRIPYSFHRIKFKGEHYWEIGYKGFPISLVRQKILTYFDIIKEVRPIMSTCHHFFVLKKKQIK